jgi:chemotaxis receptor (MCP) glutamine deamidase CheD
MSEGAKHVEVEADAFRVARESLVLACELQAALAICVHDDTQASGGILHLRYVATDKDKPVDLTDNTLSSGLLLMDRFCKELRAMGARKQSWRVRIIAHFPGTPELEAPAATVLDLVKAYFADGRLPVQVQELRDPRAIHVRFDPREGFLNASP